MKKLIITTSLLCCALALPFATAGDVQHFTKYADSMALVKTNSLQLWENTHLDLQHIAGIHLETNDGYQEFTEAFGLQQLVDINPDPHIVEINLEAREDYVEMIPGVPSKVYTYNGTVPGPLIRGTVGDTLIVHFTNNLPEPTTIHWHGLRLPADMDGSSMSQNPIPPGESFTYELAGRCIAGVREKEIGQKIYPYDQTENTGP